jgi:hypothetical protein
MKSLKPTLLALSLTMVLSSTASAGNIPATRMAGNIPATRMAGNIPATRTNLTTSTPRSARRTLRFDLETVLSDTFPGLFRLLLESGALF